MKRYEKLDLLGQKIELRLGLMYHPKDMHVKLTKFEQP